MTCPCPLPHRAARNRTRGAPKPHPSNSPARPGKAERCERAQSVPARPAGRYAEPPAAALRPPSRDENSRNPALQAARCLFLRCSSSSEDRACSFHIAAARSARCTPPPPPWRRCAAPAGPRSHTIPSAAPWKAAFGRYSRVSCSLPSLRSHRDTGANDLPPRR